MTENTPQTHGLTRPLRLFAWDVLSADAGQAGVTDDRNTAIRHVHEAMRRSGTFGKVRRVALAPDGSAAYVDLDVIGEAWADATTGAIVRRSR